MDGASGTQWQSSAATSQLDTISQALNASLDPRIDNAIRQQAFTFLEQVKTQPDAPNYGFTLADDLHQPDAVRHYGLQLLEHAVRYHWADYSEGQTEQLRTWVKRLAGGVRDEDEVFVRNKIGQLWAEIAKRSWGEEWMDMDAMLVALWDEPMEVKGFANKALVLYILETLSEDICNREDATAGLRLEVLGSALNEIIIPEGLYKQHLESRGNGQEVRSGSEGWLARVCAFFGICVKQLRIAGGSGNMKGLKSCAIKALNTLRPTVAWISLKAMLEVDCMEFLFLPFHIEDTVLQTAAVEVMYALMNRPYNAHFQESELSLLHQSLRPDRVEMIELAFGRTRSVPGEDEEKYNLQKKMSEVLSILADAISQHPALAGMKLDMNAFFSLLTDVLQSDSLVVSIPVLHSWTKLLAVQDTTVIDLVMQALGTLLETCSTRLINYEALPEDSDDSIVRFLFEDFDTMPERHAFLGNYRRYCVSVIETISRQRPLEALSHVLEQTTQMLKTGPYTRGRGFDSAKYSKTSLPRLRFDAQFNVVLSVIKGVSQWESDIAGITPDDPLRERADHDRWSVQAMFEQWCSAIPNVHVDDPEVASQVLILLSSILRNSRPEAKSVLHTVQHMLTMRLYDNAAHTTFSEAIKNFEVLRVAELQKVALVFANDLLEVFTELENRVNVMIQKHSDDTRLTWGHRAFLFMIVLRGSGIDNQMRTARLQHMLTPVYEAWQDPALVQSVATLDSFCGMLGLGDLTEFYKKYRFAEVQDWASQQLDDAGQARQAGIKERFEHLPLRMTKSMLAATTEKLKDGTDEHDIACALWAPIIPVLLPRLLQLLRHAQAFNNLANWSQLPEEVCVVVRRTLQDRFWQSGISNESRDEFYARVSSSKTSYEGFASTVRGTTRNVREQGYHILYLLTRFDEQLYGLPDLAEALASALFDDAGALAANHLHPVINLSTGLVQRCPPHHRARFLPPLLTKLFTNLDRKISSEWEGIAQVTQQSGEDDDLSEEMRVESVLRQLTFSMVSFVALLLEHDRRPSWRQANGHESPAKPTLAELVLSDASVLEPLILFCTHALRMRDTRCCVTVCKLFTGVVPHFGSDAAPAPQVREFISTEVLKACITSLNEPYFADTQRDLAALVAQIILLYTPKTTTPRDVLLSLPDMQAASVDAAIGKIRKTQSARQQRALVLQLLEGVRGVSIHEAGKVARADGKRKGKGGVQAQYMEVEQRPAITDGAEVGLDGVAGLFGGA